MLNSALWRMGRYGEMGCVGPPTRPPIRVRHSSWTFSCGAGLGRVHDRYISSPRQVHDRLSQIQSLRGDTGNPCDMMTPLVQRPDPRAVSLANGTMPVFPPAAGDAHSVTALVQPQWGMARADPAAHPGRGYEQGQHAACREQNGEEPAGRNARHTQVRRGVRRPDNGTKRAQIGKGSGYTHRSFRPDAVRYMSVTTATHRPTVTHPDTWRDKKETARRAAFPQQAGRFPWWWQVLGSNQGRRSRRFYSHFIRGMVALREIRAGAGRGGLALLPRDS